MGTANRHFTPGCFYLGCLAAAAGFAFYLAGFSAASAIANWPMSVFFGSAAVKFSVLSSFPSFSHALASSLLLVSLVSISSRAKLCWIGVVLCISLALELTMGTFDVMDVYALLLGSGLGSLPLLVNRKTIIVNKAVGVLPAMLVTMGAATFAAGSYYGGDTGCRFDCGGPVSYGNPTYMSYNDLRSAVRQEPPHDLMEIGRLYLYKNLIFMNERNEGIHIIDNIVPSNPTPIGFIRIPGNLDINIRGDYLYADSYVDLVTLDVSDISNIREVNRQTDIFPYDPYQNIPDDIYIETYLVDSSRGVVIGYE